MDSEQLKDKVLLSFEASRIQLVEWENSLLRRLGYPCVPVDLVYLVPDERLSEACDIASGHGLRPANRGRRIPSYPAEFADVGFYFLVNDFPEGSFRSHRLILLPMSWTGINSNELVPIAAPEDSPPPPCTVLTVPRAAACAAFVRMAARERRGSLLRGGLLSSLCHVLTYSLFDMSYEGDYMEFPPDDQPETEEEKLEREMAIVEINRWNWRDSELWIKDALVAIVSGKAKYEDLPYGEM